MKKLLILSRREDRPQYDTPDAMAKAMAQVQPSVDYTFGYLEDISFLYDGHSLMAVDTGNNCDLQDFDGIFLMGWFKNRKTEDTAKAVGLYMRAKGKKVLNSEAIQTRSRTKLSQLVLATLHGVPTPKFLTINNPARLTVIRRRMALDFPLIVKSASAYRGSHNFLVRNEQELQKAVATMPSKIITIQQYIENDGDLRVLVMGGKVSLIIKRQATGGSHLNNTSQGGKPSLLNADDVDNRVLDDCVKLAGLLGREVTGVDMIQDKQTKKYYFLEINNMPQLGTGSFVPEKMSVLDAFFDEWLTSK